MGGRFYRLGRFADLALPPQGCYLEAGLLPLGVANTEHKAPLDERDPARPYVNEPGEWER